MSLMTRLRLTAESSLEEGTPDEVMAKNAEQSPKHYGRRASRSRTPEPTLDRDRG